MSLGIITPCKGCLRSLLNKECTCPDSATGSTVVIDTLTVTGQEEWAAVAYPYGASEGPPPSRFLVWWSRLLRYSCSSLHLSSFLPFGLLPGYSGT